MAQHLDTATTAKVADFFAAEPAALTAVVEQRSTFGSLMALVVCGRDGSQFRFDASEEAKAAAFSDRLAERLAR